MKLANIFVIALITICSACIEIGYKREGLIYFFGQYSTLVMQWIFLLTWGICLILLYRTVKAKDKILPNSKIFGFHGTVLVLYLLCYGSDIYF